MKLLYFIVLTGLCMACHQPRVYRINGSLPGALDGYVVRLELPELREMVSLLRRSSNNLNQLTRRVHETGRIYDADLEDLRQGQEKLWEAAEHILSALAALK